MDKIFLSSFTSFKIGGTPVVFERIKTEQNLIRALQYARAQKLRVHILGGGSNTLFHEGLLSLAVLKIELKGITLVKENKKNVVVEIGAGVPWDEAVLWAVKHDFSGIEAMSIIPGTTGATPIQNVGAYGQEIKDTLVKVKVMNRKTFEIKEMTHSECLFSYRNSVFKKKNNPFIILSVFLSLKKNKKGELIEIPNYTDVKKYFKEKQKATLREIRRAIIKIRSRKLPNPRMIPNVGSFFKNAVVSQKVAKKLKNKYEDMPQFQTERGVKIPAGWLIEKAGLKGFILGKVQVYEHNALVLVNINKAEFKDVALLRDKIIKEVFNKFGVVLEQEPVEVGMF